MFIYLYTVCIYCRLAYFSDIVPKGDSVQSFISTELQCLNIVYTFNVTF